MKIIKQYENLNFIKHVVFLKPLIKLIFLHKVILINIVRLANKRSFTLLAVVPKLQIIGGY
ncbi:MAG: hypothetical protein DRI73_09160 [Bacteroidetes bacterium]|nr:MAG: hypothetical protein DRI73_09160 [Bacteroidota bacterium]